MTACAHWNRVISELWPQAEASDAQVWTLLDAARDDRIVGAIENSRLDYCCPLGGRLEAALKTAAPYLVKLRFGHPFTEYVVSHGWDHHWGVFLQSDASMEELRLHLKQFLRVRAEDGRRLFFRFYDPRVLRVFLPTCTAHELRMFYGPILRFVMEDEEPASLLEFALPERELKGGIDARATFRERGTMMTIRDEQMSALSTYSRRQFENLIIRRLREEFAEDSEGVDQEEMRAFVIAQIHKAASYNIGRETDVSVYIDRAAFYGEEWDTSLEWARRILNDPELDGPDKIRQIRMHEAVSMEMEEGS